MTDARPPEQILARTSGPTTNGRPVRKDEIELHDRGLYIESWLPERRSRRKPLLLVHGELPAAPDALRVPARLNRVAPVPQLGPLPCVGAYAQVVQPGRVDVGDTVRLD